MSHIKRSINRSVRVESGDGVGISDDDLIVAEHPEPVDLVEKSAGRPIEIRFYFSLAVQLKEIFVGGNQGCLIIEQLHLRDDAVVFVRYKRIIDGSVAIE